MGTQVAQSHVGKVGTLVDAEYTYQKQGGGQKIEGGAASGDNGVRGLYVDKLVTSAQILALFATPVEIVPAPGAGKALVLTGAQLFLDYNSAAYAGIAAGEDLVLKYTNASGATVTTIEATGFLDATADALRYAFPATTAAITPVANAALVLHMLTGEITTGNSPLIVRAFYDIIPTTLA